MKNNTSRFLTGIALVLAAASGTEARADGSGGLSFFEEFFGKPKARHQAENARENGVGSEACDGYDGFLGMVNGFFCHMEKDMGITGPGSATKVFGSMTVHAEVAKTPTSVTVGGTTYAYDYVAQVWTCSSACTVKTNFSPAFYIAWSNSADATVNKGFVLTDPGAFNGAPGSGMQLLYDLGSATSTKTVAAKAYMSAALAGGTAQAFDARGSKDANGIMRVNMIFSGGGFAGRFAASAASSGLTKDFLMYFENSGASGSGTAALDAAGTAAIANSSGVCLSATEADTGIAASSSVGTCTGLSLNAFGATSSTVGSYNATSVLTPLGGTIWNGMNANPAAL